MIVEGPTEESFVSGPLAEALWPRQVYLTPIILGVPGHKGGRTNYARVQKDILRQLKQDPTAYCSTMIDFYGLGQGFPGTPPPAHFSSIQKVEHIGARSRMIFVLGFPNRVPIFAWRRIFPFTSTKACCLAIRTHSLKHLHSPAWLAAFVKSGMIFRRRRISMTVLRALPPNG